MYIYISKDFSFNIWDYIFILLSIIIIIIIFLDIYIYTYIFIFLLLVNNKNISPDEIKSQQLVFELFCYIFTFYAII